MDASNANNLRMPDTKALLWDIDGTLIDTTALIVNALGDAFRSMLHYDLPPEQLRGMIGIPLDEQIRMLGTARMDGVSPDDLKAEVIRNYERQRSREQPISEALDALIEGKRLGLKTALVTSKNDVELAHTLPRLGISAYCDAIVGADQVAPNYKPHPRPVKMALELLGISDPREAIFIGDSLHDMHSARSAGVRLAAVLWGAATADALRAEKPDYLFERPHDLLHFVRELSGEALAA